MDETTPPDDQPGIAGVDRDQVWSSTSQGIEIYADSSNISATFYSIIMEFGLSQRAAPGQLVARVRMSPEHAKTFALVLLHGLNAHEQAMGYRIPVPAEIAAQIDIGDFFTNMPIAGKATLTEEQGEGDITE